MVINFFVYESNYCDMWTYYLDLATILMRKKYMELLVLGVLPPTLAITYTFLVLGFLQNYKEILNHTKKGSVQGNPPTPGRGVSLHTSFFVWFKISL